ncbi:transcriptional regulator [Lentzea sp. NBRC 105346]|nr:transcriptional regulator [Lentzea sp. NBRC 105346]
MANPPPPLARRIELGALLRTYRERAGLDVAEVAGALGWSYVQKVGLVEGGKRRLAPAEVTVLAELFELSAEERDKVVALGRDARKRDPGPVFAADWAQTYIALETAATQLKVYAEELLPGLLQTEDYARVVLLEGGVLLPHEIDRAVEQRAERQKRLEETRLTAVLSESGLRRQVGGPTIMRRQLEHIVELAQRPNVAFQVLPFGAGAHLALGTSFTLIPLGDPLVTFVYVEALTDSDFYDRPPHTEVYTLAFDRAQRAALPAPESLAVLDQLVGELKQLE